MAEITISGIPPVVSVFTVFVASAEIVRNRTLLKNLPQGFEKTAIEVDTVQSRACRFGQPNIGAPDRIRAFFRKNRDERISSPLTASLI
jgi:hypothetical protein